MPRLNLCESKEEKDDLVEFLRTNRYPEGLTKVQKRNFRRKADNFVMLRDDLCFRGKESLLKVVFPFEVDLVKHIIEIEHSISHMGVNKLQDLIKRKYYGIPQSMISDHVSSCESCRRYNSVRTIQPVYINDITKKYDRYMMDCVDIRRYADQNDGYSWLLNVIDTFSKYLWSFKLINKTAEAVKQSLEFIFDNFGVPLSIQSDNGKEFRNQVLHDFLSSNNINIIHGRPRNPKSQGQVERVNQTVKRWLSKKLYGTNGQRWIDFHRDVVYAYNRTIHRAVNHSPFMLFFGHQGFNLPTSGGDFVEDVDNNSILMVENTNNDIDNLIEIDENSFKEYEEWNFEDYDPSLYEEIQASNQVVILHESKDEADLRNGTLAYFEKYKNKTIENADSNLVSRNLEIGDQVLIKKDFDTNPGTKKLPFDSFYENSIYSVTDFLENNRIRVQDENGNTKTVFKGVIKKI